MKHVLLCVAAATMAVLPAMASASDCRTRGLAGTWLMGASNDLLCALQVRRNGNFTASCRTDKGPSIDVKGRMTLNGQCVLRLIGDEAGIRLEGRAWATNNSTRMDAFQGTMTWKVEEGPSWLTVSGHRRPGADRLPID